MEDQWLLHCQTLLAVPKHNFRDIAKIRAEAKDVVIHCQDHAANQLMMFCPVLYHKMVLDTFETGPVFRKLSISPAGLLNHVLKHTISKHIKRRYNWGINTKAKFPSAYVCPKKKKQWTTARSIISYNKTVFSKLFTALGRILKDMTDVAYPSNLHKETMPEILKALRNYFLSNSDTSGYKFYNEDLEGFYTSIPQERILAATRHMIMRYFEQHPSDDPSSVVLSTIMSQKQRQGRTIRGRSYVRQNLTKQIHVGDIEELVKLAIECSYVTVMGIVYIQVRGAPIGSQAAPAICNLTVSFDEEVWQITYHIVKRSDTIAQRYVDNRLAIMPAHVSLQTGYQHFLTLDFYEPPVQLLRVEDINYVGFDIDVPGREVRYILPTEDWQFRSTLSAGTESTLLSGYRSRVHIIIRGVFPRIKVRPTIQLLTDHYIKLGFCKVALDNVWKHCIYSTRFNRNS